MVDDRRRSRGRATRRETSGRGGFGQRRAQSPRARNQRQRGALRRRGRRGTVAGVRRLGDRRGDVPCGGVAAPGKEAREFARFTVRMTLREGRTRADGTDQRKRRVPDIGYTRRYDASDASVASQELPKGIEWQQRENRKKERAKRGRTSAQTQIPEPEGERGQAG
ncbi:hypothetical protein BV20DRAFT_821613 [Pilatotrama ljubarskyi]|nr:hypothetical protein BV20DRAFT_821613 [Pilatotrama ljubarskyi]